MNRLLQSASLLALSGMIAAGATAQDTPTRERRLKSVEVTATKRTETAQSIPVTVTALGEQDLEQLGVQNFSDYLVQLPGVTAGGSGPGQNTIYIRGLASTTPALTTAGVSGLAPNVSFYLDEQPLAQPGRNLDIYVADMERVEVLSGPQGTLFGASSQAGTVRLITNKPNFDGVSANFKASTSFTEGGEMSNSAQAMINLPVTDKFAVRGVVYTDKAGGYIDNVAGTRSVQEGARFQPGGFQGTANLDNVTFVDADNARFVEDDFNDATYNGFRVSGLYDFNQDWSLLVSHLQQQLDVDGVFFADGDPSSNLDEYEIQRFTDDDLSDKIENTAWTLEGRIGALEALYTGAFTERTTDQSVDYTDYMFAGQYFPYYVCDTPVVYPQYLPNTDPVGTCFAPDSLVDSHSELKIQTHEIRFNTPSENRWRATFGAFYSDLELAERNDFTYFGSIQARGADGVTVGFVPNYPLTDVSTTGQIGIAAPGYFSDPGSFPAGVMFRNDILRTDQQLGVFGETTFDINDQFALTLGARWYDVEVDFKGSANGSYHNKRSPVFGPNVGNPPATNTDTQTRSANISTQFSGNGPAGAPDVAATDGVIFKATGEWTPTDNLLFYATYSEGFRPGFLNRPGGVSNNAGTYSVPYAFDTDEVTNYEIGWKTELFQNSLRFNGSAFFVEIEGLQMNVFEPSITNLFFSDNAANAEITGLEGDFTWAPYEIDGLTIAGAFSLLDTEVTDVLIDGNFLDVGSDLAFAPAYQGNLRARYEWDLEQQIAGQSLTAHVMPQLAFSDEAIVDIINVNKAEIDGWTTFGGTVGVTGDNWTAELFATNLTNEYAELSNNFNFNRERITPMRPRTVGIRFSYDFN